ncbi:MAG: hypothetical protein OXN94_07690 [Chloroflexota bacterium]|nr:hypothetical protein [Chloroflexota bacterium]
MGKNDAEMNRSYKHLVSEIAIRMIDLDMDFSIEVNRRYVDPTGALQTREQLHNNEQHMTKVFVTILRILDFPQGMRSTEFNVNLETLFNHIISPIAINMEIAKNFQVHLYINGTFMGKWHVMPKFSHQSDKH